jgi:succinate dehydrogenase / fumarate reductase cytochrome b subunit
MSTLLKSVLSFLRSSIGKKILVAITGAVLVLFVLGHMIGNLLVFAGPHAINQYGHFLKTMLHGAGLWIARGGLLVSAAIHVVLTIQLTRENRAARAERYGFNASIQTSKSSRFMIVSGLFLLAFIVYHLLHFTVQTENGYGSAAYKTSLDGHEVHNVYKMVVDGFSWVPASVFYIVAMGFLCSHLSHGVSSMFQTLGLATERTKPHVEKFGNAYAALIFLGNCSIPIAILLHLVK